MKKDSLPEISLVTHYSLLLKSNEECELSFLEDSKKWHSYYRKNWWNRYGANIWESNHDI